MNDDNNTMLIYYDGSCNACLSFVKSLKRFVQDGSLIFIPFQLVSSDTTSWNTIIVIANNKEYKATAAAIVILETMKGFAKITASFLKLFPIAFLDRLYYFIARNGYRWFGQCKTCTV